MKKCWCLEGEPLEALVSQAQYDSGRAAFKTQLARIFVATRRGLASLPKSLDSRQCGRDKAGQDVGSLRHAEGKSDAGADLARRVVIDVRSP